MAWSPSSLNQQAGKKGPPSRFPVTINWPSNIFLCTQLWHGSTPSSCLRGMAISHLLGGLYFDFLVWTRFEYFLLKWDSVVHSLPRALNPRLLNHALWFEPPSGVEVLSAALIKMEGGWRVRAFLFHLGVLTNTNKQAQKGIHRSR